MDKETKEYFDRKMLGLAQKEDIEKLRQEGKANLRQWKEDDRAQRLEWKEEGKADLETLRKEWSVAIIALREKILEEFRKMAGEAQSARDQSHLFIETHQRRMTDELKGSLERSKAEALFSLETMGRNREETKAEIDRLREGMRGIETRLKQMIEELGLLGGGIKGGLSEVREEIGSMIKFSSADLEKKIAALEARIKVLEKGVGT